MVPDNVPHILRVGKIERTFELGLSERRTVASVAFTKVDNSGAHRDEIRNKSDQLIQTLIQMMTTDDDDPVTIRHMRGSAPVVYRGEAISKLKVSVSNSGPWIAVGLTRQGSIGVDIQVGGSRSRFCDIAKFINLDAAAQVNEQQFLSYWVLRESIAKATNNSVLTSHAVEPQLAAACRNHGHAVAAGSFTAMVQKVSPDTHLAVVLNENPASPTCV